MSGTWVRVVGVAVAVAAAVAVVAACGPVTGTSTPTPRATATAASTGAPAPSAAPRPAAPGAGTVRATGLPAVGAGEADRVGGLLPVDGAAVDVEDTGDGARTVTVTGPPGPPGTVGWVAPPRGGRADVQADGSVTLHDDTGAVVAALAAPEAADGTRGAWQPDGEVLALHAPAGAVTFAAGASAVESATWGDADGGRSLLVVPAAWVRTGSLAAQHALVSQVAAAEPEAASASMQAQLWCHVLGAPDKASWNVEPWRPDVPTATLLATRCNPTDADR